MTPHCDTCPFAFTDESEMAQNYGCLPTPHDIVHMRVEHGKTWACHDESERPCIGGIRHLAKHALPYSVVRPLVTERDDWHRLAS